MAEKIVEVDGKRYMKVQKGKYFDKKKNRKMRRHHPVRWILISAFCLLVVAPVGFVFGAFYDPSTKQIDDTVEKFNERMISTLSESVLNLPNNGGVLQVELKNEFIDSILAQAKSTLLKDPTVGKFINKIYVNIDGNNYDFVIEAQFSFFKTKLHLNTKLQEPTDDNPYYIFKINNIGLGRLPLGSLAKTILNKFITKEQIESALSAEPLNLHPIVSLDDLEIKFERTQFKKDIGDFLESYDLGMGDTLSAFVLNLYSVVDSSASFKDKISIKIDFSKIGKLPDTVRNGISQTKDFKNAEANHAKKVTEFLNNKTLSDPTKSGLLFEYFMYGYSHNVNMPSLFVTTDSEGKQTPDTKLINACKKYLGIEDHVAYPGSEVYTNNKIDAATFGTKITTAISAIPSIEDLKNGINLATVSDSDLSDFLRSSIPMGYTYGLPIKSGNDEYNFAYISVNDFYVNVSSSAFNIYSNLNLNSFSVPLELDCEIINPIKETGGTFNTKEIKISPKTIKLGKITIPSTASTFLLDFIGSSFTTSQASLIGFKNNMFTFDVSGLQLSTGGLNDTINKMLKGETVTIGSTNIEDDELFIGFASSSEKTMEISAQYLPK